MADTNFSDPERVTLLTDLKKAFEVQNGVQDVPTTIWAYLWFSDIDKLRAMRDEVQRSHLFGAGLLVTHRDLVLRCEFINFYTFLIVSIC